MADRGYPKVFVTQKAEKSLKEGHPWVFEDEVTEESGCADGEICDVISPKGRWMGSGFYNGKSKIRVRVISRNTNDRFDEAFWKRRVKYAVDYRRCVMGDDFSCCRLIFGEADFFPGLTVDRFSDVLVCQIACLGIEKIKDIIYSALLEELGGEISALYERGDAPVRGVEGLPQKSGFYFGEGSGETEIRENGIIYTVDYINGQKTGFFLDQKYNRLAAARIAPGKKVLDCFTHTGAFALNAAKAGADSVTAVDISADAIEMTRRNAERNGLDGKMDFLVADVFDLLTTMQAQKRHDYDYIILDPPAFTKSSSTIGNAIKGYREINSLAMKILPRGGYLATCSCSHFMRDSLFCSMLHDAARDAGVRLRQIEARQQSPDHPILWSVPETDYLKFYIFQTV